jgi:26S proteasome regulatory subunit N9
MATSTKPPRFVLDEFIALALSNTPQELHPYFESFRSLYTKKYVLLIYIFNFRTKRTGFFVNFRLWHQLTKKLFEFFDHPLAKPYRVDTFERFVGDCEGKINQLRLVEMGVKVSKDIDSMSLPQNDVS